MNLSPAQRRFKQFTKLPADIVRFLLRPDGTPNGEHFYFNGKATKQEIAELRKRMKSKKAKKTRAKKR